MMSNAYVETKIIRDLSRYLRNTDKDEIIVRTTYVKNGQGWHDEFDANRAGFSISRFINPEYVKKHEFAECYYLKRK